MPPLTCFRDDRRVCPTVRAAKATSRAAAAAPGTVVVEAIFEDAGTPLRAAGTCVERRGKDVGASPPTAKAVAAMANVSLCLD